MIVDTSVKDAYEAVSDIIDKVMVEKDWYEGGTINLISFIPISEINSIGEISGAHIF